MYSCAPAYQSNEKNGKRTKRCDMDFTSRDMPWEPPYAIGRERRQQQPRTLKGNIARKAGLYTTYVHVVHLQAAKYRGS
jgi:hypothetical protein